MTMQTVTLDRISVTNLRDRLNDHTKRRYPVIVTNLLEGQPLELFSDLSIVKEQLGEEPLVIRQNYISSTFESLVAFHKGHNTGRKERRTTIRSYLELIDESPATPWLGTEVPTPQKLLDKIQLRSIGITTISAGYGDRTVTTDDTAHSLMFIANAGNSSDLHTDWDGRNVILYQAVGRKRVTLFPTEAAAKLHPIQILGSVRLAGLPEETRSDLIGYANGWDDMLNPGEAVFIPAFYWHHLEYTDAGMSLSFRFGGIKNKKLLFILCNGHADLQLQRMLATALEANNEERVAAVLTPVANALAARYSSARKKYAAVAESYRQAFTQFYGEEPECSRLTWIDCTMLLDGVLCARYGLPSPGQSKLGRGCGCSKSACAKSCDYAAIALRVFSKVSLIVPSQGARAERPKGIGSASGRAAVIAALGRRTIDRWESKQLHAVVRHVYEGAG